MCPAEEIGKGMETWLQQAQKLEVGRRRKITHCGRSPSMIVENALRGWRAYCHRCGANEWEGRTSLLSVAELQQLNGSLRTTPPRLPDDFKTGYEEHTLISVLWMTWLSKGGITQSLREEFGLGWSQKYSKAVVPILNASGSLDGVLYRDLTGSGAKYILRHKHPEKAVYIVKPKLHVIQQNDGSAGNINCEFDCVIVEDVLSAIRVGQFIPTGSLLGTSVGQGKLERILSASGKSKPRVALWLDPDKAGQSGMETLSKQLKLFGIHGEVITSSKDPKGLSNREIVRKLTHDSCVLLADYEEPRANIN